MFLMFLLVLLIAAGVIYFMFDQLEAAERRRK
jgi:hypothetical protein